VNDNECICKYKSHFHEDKTLSSSPKLKTFENICYWYGYVLGLWCLTSLLAIFQIYRGCQFYWWRKPEKPEKTTDYYDIILHRVHVAWAGFELTTSVVIGIDCIGSCPSNYHAINNTTERHDMNELLLRVSLNIIIPSM
jgi:hypothetical protein